MSSRLTIRNRDRHVAELQPLKRVRAQEVSQRSLFVVVRDEPVLEPTFDSSLLGGVERNDVVVTHPAEKQGAKYCVGTRGMRKNNSAVFSCKSKRNPK